MPFHLIPLLIGAAVGAAVAGTAYVVYRYRDKVRQVLNQLGRLASKVWKITVKVYKVAHKVYEVYEFFNSFGSLLHSQTQSDSWYSTPSDVQQSINNYGEYWEEYTVNN